MFRTLLIALLVLISTMPSKAAEMIGLSLPLTGRFAPVAERMEFGALMALEKLKKSGRDVELTIVDDGCNETETVKTANKLLESQAQIVVGPPCFKLAASLAKALNTKDGETPTIPVIAYNTRNSLLMRIRYIDDLPLYDLSNADKAEAAAVAKFILPRFAGKPYAIIDDGSVYGRALADELRLLGEQSGRKPIAAANFRPLQTTQISMLRRLKRSGVEALFISASADDVLTIAGDLKKLKLDWILATGEQAALLPFMQANSVIPQGLLMVRETDFDTSGSGDLLKQIESQNIEIEPSLLAGYALIEIAAQAIKDDRPDAMGQTFNTIIGPLTFDAEGRAPPAPYGLFRWDGTGFTADSGN